MSDRVYIIAEAGVNHDGELDRALSMVDAAAEAGADAIKFQTFDPAALVTDNAPQADYQIRNDNGNCGQLTMLQRLVLSHDDHHRLMTHCATRGIDFMSSPFDSGSARFLIDDLQLPRLKLGSGELTNAPLLLQIARSGRALILSTGMCDMADIREALGVLAFGYFNADTAPSQTAFADAFSHVFDNPDTQQALAEKVTLLHCTSEYPAPFADVNLRAMDTLREACGLPVGFSDHTPGINMPVAAVARGACMVEKHFTLDRNLPGPDHRASLEPDELRDMVEGIRQLEQALGDGHKQVAPSEAKNRAVARKSLVAASPIRRGETFTEANLTSKRPGDGLPPIHYWTLLGLQAHRDYTTDEAIDTGERPCN